MLENLYSEKQYRIAWNFRIFDKPKFDCFVFGLFSFLFFKILTVITKFLTSLNYQFSVPIYTPAFLIQLPL